MKKILCALVMLFVFSSCLLAQTVAQVMNERSGCPALTNLVVDHIAGTSALLTWTAGASAVDAQYYVEYAVQGTTAWSQEVTNTNRLLMAGLQPQTSYDVRVFMQCQDGYSDTVRASFNTECLAGGSFTVGNGTEFESNLPSNAYWNFSYSQQLFSASEMNGANTLESISFDCVIAYSGARNLSIYLMHTSQTNPTTWLSAQDAQLVYSGIVNFVSGWNTLTFNTPFEYNGVDNLAVVIVDQTGSYSSTNYFNAHETSNLTLYFTSDTESPSVTSLPSAVNSVNHRLNTRFGASCNNTVTCVAPNVIVADVSSEAITLEWAPGVDEYMWNIDYRALTETNWTSVGPGAYSPLTIEHLMPMTTYEIRIASDCGNEMVSAPVLLEVTTACQGIDVLPFTENFDGLSNSEQIPMCWTSGTSQAFVTPVVHYLANSAPYSMNFDANASNYAYLALPRLSDDIDVSNLTITFNAMRLTEINPDFVVGVMSNPGDISTFTPIAQAYPATAGPWELMEVNTFSYTGSARYLAFRSNCYMFIDDITVSESPSCYHVSNVTVDNITATTADLQWTIGAHESAWDVAYGLHGTIDPDAASYVTVTDAPAAALTGLVPDTYYDVYVRSNCGSQQSEWEMLSFWSGCEMLSTLPYSQNFDMVSEPAHGYASTNNLPNCWNYLNAGSMNDQFPIVVESPDDAASGTNCIYFATMNGGGYGEQYAILPEVNTQSISMNGLALSLDAKATAYGDLQLVAGVMTDPTMAATFVPVDTILITGTNYQTYTMDFVSYFGAGSYVAIMAPAAQTNEGYVDNVVLNYHTDCARPTSLQLTNLNTSDIRLNWTVADPSQNSWEVEYGPRNFNVGTGEGSPVMVYGDPETTLLSLDDGIYDFYVRSACDNGEWSNWYGPVTGCANAYVMTQNASDALTSCSRLIVDNGGLSGHYAANSNDILVVYPDQTGMVTNITGTFNLEGYADVLSIYDGVGITGELLWESSAAQSNTGTVDVTSTTGPLTLHFVSNGYTCYDGFELMVNCVDAPLCVRPANLSVSNVSNNAVTLGWTAYGQETEWVIEYGEAGFATGLGAQITVAANTYTIQNLAPNTAYDFYVRALCSNVDTSDYSVAVTAATTQVLAQTPFFTDFDNAQENAMWTLVNGDQTNKWYIGQPAGCTDNVLFVSNNGTDAEYDFDATSVVWAYRDIQFSSSAPEFELSFNWKAEGESSYGISYDYVNVFLADPMDVQAGILDESSMLELSGRLNRQSSWQHFTTVIDGSVAGQTKRLYFVWKNDNRYGNNPSAMIDSVQIREQTCVSPRNLVVTAVTDQTATLFFQSPANSGQWQYVCYYTPFNPDDLTPTSINDTNFTISNLWPQTMYYVYVRANCSSTEHSHWTGPLTFMTDTAAYVPTCDVPGYVMASNVTHNSALITWTPVGMEESWNIQYKEASASSWSSSMYTTSPGYTLTNLTESTTYQVRVQAVCDESLTSDWTDITAFTTTPDGVNGYVLDAAISVYPNPTTGEFTIYNAQSNIRDVNVFDVYGKMLNAMAVNNATAKVDLGLYAEGVYFVRVTTDNGVVTKRVVKK